jgi:hypothetical protein
MIRLPAAVFETYGTLSGAHPAMPCLAPQLIATLRYNMADGRQNSLEYSDVHGSVRSSPGPALPCEFRQVIYGALGWTATRPGMTGAAVLTKACSASRSDPRPEVPAILWRIGNWRLAQGIPSNREPGVLADAVAFTDVDEILDFVLSAETVDVFQPTPSAYRLAKERLGSEITSDFSNPRSSKPGGASGRPEEPGRRQLAIQPSKATGVHAALSPRRAS